MKTLLELFEKFLRAPPDECQTIYNERSLQLELGYFFRLEGYKVEFERPFPAPRPDGSTKRPKTNLDLFIQGPGTRGAIELKVPLNKRHPETLYDYCADIEFIEALLRSGTVDEGVCLLMTNDRVFWEDSGRGSTIHNCFRRIGNSLTGRIQKPTGQKDTAVVLTGRYEPAKSWLSVGSAALMRNAQYLLISVEP